MITFGRHTYINLPSDRFDPKVTIGSFCSIGAGVVFYGGGEHPPVFNRSAVSSYPFWEKGWGEYTKCGSRGDIVIGNDVWIGEDVRIMDGVHIGDGAIIGAMAVVTKDVPPYAVLAGNPGRVVKYRFAPEQIIKLLEIKWWNWSDDVIRERLSSFSNIDTFLSSLTQLT